MGNYAWIIVKGQPTDEMRAGILAMGLDICGFVRVISDEDFGLVVHYDGSQRSLTRTLNDWFVSSCGRSQTSGDLLWWRPSDAIGQEVSGERCAVSQRLPH